MVKIRIFKKSDVSIKKRSGGGFRSYQEAARGFQRLLGALDHLANLAISEIA